MTCLVADIGGTNSRFALCEAGSMEIRDKHKQPNEEFNSLDESLAHYLSQTGAKPDSACIAVACPVLGDKITLTNIDWSFSIRAMQQQFGFKQLHVTNDFTALAMAVSQLQPDMAIQIGTGTAIPKKPIGVLGPGTGLGVSGLLWSGSGWVAIQGEGGQVGLKAGNDLEIEILHIAQEEYGFACAERVLSGIGLPFLHNALLEIQGKPAEAGLKAEDIATRALADKCDDCHHTIEVFGGMLGAFAGDHALTLGAFGGIYIGGGVAPQLQHLFTEGPFRQRFEDKGRFSDYVKKIPTFCLKSYSDIALVGAAVILNQELGFGI